MRRLLVDTGVHSSAAFPADAYVIGDLTISQVKAVARQNDLTGPESADLSELGLSGAVISQDFGLRPAAAALMLQLALATPEPIREGEPVLNLLRLLTHSRFTAEEANWLREGKAGKIVGYGDWNKFSIVRMGARLAKRISDAAMSAIMSAASA